MGTATAIPAELPKRDESGRRSITRGERNALMLRHMAFARSLARRYANRGEPLDDLEQVAAIGLLKAIERYDPARGDLRAFATPTILGEIRRHFRDRTWTIRPGRNVQDASARVQRSTDELVARCGRTPSVSEIAEEADLSEEEVLDAIAARSAYRPISLSAPAREGEDSDPIAVPWREDGYDRAEDRVIVDVALGHLPARERMIVLLRFREDLTQAEIAQRLDISQMHVSRLLRRAMDTLNSLQDSPATSAGKGG
jgi:RNA polymerase sigma-B factor